MADSLSSTVRALISSLRSTSPQRGTLAAHLASDLYSLAVESVSDTELGMKQAFSTNMSVMCVHVITGTQLHVHAQQ